MIDAERHFALRSDLEICYGEGGLFLIDGDEELSFATNNRVTFESLLLALDGTRSLAELGERLGIAGPQIQRLVHDLVGAGLVRPVNPGIDEWVSMADFEAQCRVQFIRWKQRVFSRPVWSELNDGSAPFPIFVGWVLEQYHYIQGVNDRLAYVISMCDDISLRAIFVQHFVEEYDHSRYFLEALAGLGLESERVLTHRALPGTRAVLGFMRDAARMDPLAYAVCSAFLESTGADRDATTGFYDSIGRHYCPDKPELIQPIVDHVNLDLDYGHSDNFTKMCALFDRIPATRASLALQAGLGLVETLELWSDDIYRHYRRGEPTRRCRLPAEDHDERGEATDLLDEYRQQRARWEASMHEHPSWRVVAGGPTSRTLALGWLLELRHLALGVHEHLATAVANSGFDAELQLALARSFARAHAVDGDLLEALSTVFDPAQVQRSRPLASTRALLNYLTELALGEVELYLAIVNSLEIFDSAIAHLSDEFEFAGAVARAIREHGSLSVIDRSTVEAFLRRSGPLGSRSADVFAALRDLHEYLLLFMDGIHEYYAAANYRMLRPQVDIRTMV